MGTSAAPGRQVINIHQPAETLFRLADSLMVLSGGKVAYCGAAAAAVQFFSVQMKKPIPLMTSSSEYLLDLVNADFTDPAEVDRLLAGGSLRTSTRPTLRLLPLFPSSALAFTLKVGHAPTSVKCLFFNVPPAWPRGRRARSRRRWWPAWRPSPRPALPGPSPTSRHASPITPARRSRTRQG